VNFTTCNFTANVSPLEAGALQVRDSARIVISACSFFNNTSFQTDLSAGGAVSIHDDAAGEGLQQHTLKTPNPKPLTLAHHQNSSHKTWATTKP
jgi:hypothetical protein